MAKSTIGLTQTAKFFTKISARTVNLLFHVATMIEPISLIVRYASSIKVRMFLLEMFDYDIST